MYQKQIAAGLDRRTEDEDANVGLRFSAGAKGFFSTATTARMSGVPLEYYIFNFSINICKYVL